MTSTVTTIGSVPWTRDDMVESLEEFSSLYATRPLADNTGGMKSPHLFLAWFVLRALRPAVIIESGVWLGQGTWFFERACPEAQIHCIDPNLDRIRYRSERATYHDRDFAVTDWSDLPVEETLLFFDDHQNAYERTKTAKWFGFKHLLFEDNYPACTGDCYSLKKAFLHSGFEPLRPAASTLKEKMSVLVGGRTLQGSDPVPPNEVDARYLRQNLDVYAELPPVFKGATTRWGDRWDDEKYPTPAPLLHSPQTDGQRIFLDEAVHYTWMCYAKLK